MKKLIISLSMAALLTAPIFAFAADAIPTIPSNFNSLPQDQKISILQNIIASIVAEINALLAQRGLPPNPSITVLSPNGGEVWRQGDQVTIKWNATNLGFGFVGINLLKDGVGFQTLGTAPILNTGSYVWTVPSGFAGQNFLGSNFKIRILNNYDPNISDESDAPFSIVAGPQNQFPDLSFSWITVGQDSATSKPVTLRADIKNIGSGPAANIALHVVNKTTGRDMGGFGGLTLAAGQEYIYTMVDGGTLWSELCPRGGNGTLTLTLDPDNFVGESNEANNVIDQSVTLSGCVTPQSSISVSLDSSTPPPSTIAAGSANVSATVLKISAASEAIDVRSLGLQFDGSNVNAITEFTIWDGTTQVGSGAFIAGRYATTTLWYPVAIPQNAYKLLTIKVNLSQVGTSQPAQAGDTVAINYDGDDKTATRGVGQSTGNTIYASGVDTAASRISVTAPLSIPVTLSAITPSSGPVGTSVRLDGCGSDSSSGFTLVYIGPKSCSAAIPVETLGAASGCGYMTITVPADFPAGAYTLQVKNNQTGAMSTNSEAFTVTAPVVANNPVASIYPTSFTQGSSFAVSVSSGANATVKIFCRKPDGSSCDDAASYSTNNSSGQFSHTYATDTSGWWIPGTYQGWVTVNGVQSNMVSFTITAPTTGGTTTGGPYILTAPASGANLPTGSTQIIQWTGGNSGAVVLQLISIASNSVVLVISSSAPNTGSFSWTIPSSLVYG